jgi:hypothetical protein
VKDVVTAGDRLGPPGIGAEVGLEHRQPLAGVGAGGLDLAADVVLAGEVADRRPDGVAAVEQRRDAPAAEVAAPSGHQDGLGGSGLGHGRNLSVVRESGREATVVG